VLAPMLSVDRPLKPSESASLAVAISTGTERATTRRRDLQRKMPKCLRRAQQDSKRRPTLQPARPMAPPAARRQ
jgi:hypothetical protein